eukprot:scaffold3936_cov128-Isochrysis_galbana.AAC.4
MPWAGLLSTRPYTLAAVGTARLRAAGRSASGRRACPPVHPRCPLRPPPCLRPSLARARSCRASTHWEEGGRKNPEPQPHPAAGHG